MGALLSGPLGGFFMAAALKLNTPPAVYTKMPIRAGNINCRGGGRASYVSTNKAATITATQNRTSSVTTIPLKYSRPYFSDEPLRIEYTPWSRPAVIITARTTALTGFMSDISVTDDKNNKQEITVESRGLWFYLVLGGPNHHSHEYGQGWNSYYGELLHLGFRVSDMCSGGFSKKMVKGLVSALHLFSDKVLEFCRNPYRTSSINEPRIQKIYPRYYHGSVPDETGDEIYYRCRIGSGMLLGEQNKPAVVLASSETAFEFFFVGGTLVNNAAGVAFSMAGPDWVILGRVGSDYSGGSGGSVDRVNTVVTKISVSRIIDEDVTAVSIYFGRGRDTGKVLLNGLVVDNEENWRLLRSLGQDMSEIVCYYCSGDTEYTPVWEIVGSLYDWLLSYADVVLGVFSLRRGCRIAKRSDLCE